MFSCGDKQFFVPVLDIKLVVIKTICFYIGISKGGESAIGCNDDIMIIKSGCLIRRHIHDAERIASQFNIINTLIE